MYIIYKVIQYAPKKRLEEKNSMKKKFRPTNDDRKILYIQIWYLLIILDLELEPEPGLLAGLAALVEKDDPLGDLQGEDEAPVRAVHSQQLTSWLAGRLEGRQDGEVVRESIWPHQNIIR